MLWVDRELARDESGALFGGGCNGMSPHTGPRGTIVYVVREAGSLEEAVALAIADAEKVVGFRNVAGWNAGLQGKPGYDMAIAAFISDRHRQPREADEP